MSGRTIKDVVEVLKRNAPPGTVDFENNKPWCHAKFGVNDNCYYSKNEGMSNNGPPFASNATLIDGVMSRPNDLLSSTYIRWVRAPMVNGRIHGDVFYTMQKAISVNRVFYGTVKCKFENDIMITSLEEIEKQRLDLKCIQREVDWPDFIFDDMSCVGGYRGY